MKISKIAKILPIALALSLCGANAAEFTADAGASNATVQYSVDLADFVKITTRTETNVLSSASSSYNTDYGSVRMGTALSADFDIISNAEQRKVKLAATCPGGTNAIKHVSDTTFQLVFGNSEHVPTADDVSGILGTPTAANNANAIGFLVTLTPTRTLGPDSSTPIKSTTWNTDHIEYVIQNGHTNLSYAVAQDNVANTFNTYDMDGLYTATLTMTDMGAFIEPAGD